VSRCWSCSDRCRVKATVPKVGAGLLACDRGECQRERRRDCLGRARLLASEAVFHRSERWLNRIVVRRIGRQVTDLDPGVRTGLADTAAVMGAGVVQQQHLAWLQRRQQHLGQIRQEALSRRAAGERCHRAKAAWRHAGQQCRRPTTVARDRFDGALATRRPAIATRQIKKEATLVDRHQARGIMLADLCPEDGPLGVAALSRNQVFFLTLQPVRPIARRMVEGLTPVPVAACHDAQCSASVASGWARNCAAIPASSAVPLTGGRPGFGRGSKLSPWRSRRRYRLTVESEMPSRSATSG
jgi:hypothetical protein